MAIPEGVGGWGGGSLRRTGIQVAAYPSTVRGVPTELQNATASSAASSKWSSVILSPSTRGPLFYTYEFPLSTQRAYFRARHNGGGYGPGSFTPTVSARPALIPDIIPPVSLNAAGNVEAPGADIWISSGNKPRVGSQNTTSYLTKTLRFSADLFTPNNNVFKFSKGVGTLVIGTTNSSAHFNMDLPLPNGTTLTKIAYRGGRRSTTGQISKVELYKISSAGIATLVSTLTMTTGSTAQATITSSALTVAISSAQHAIARAYLKATTASNRPAIVFCDITYRMPSYARTY